MVVGRITGRSILHTVDLLGIPHWHNHLRGSQRTIQKKREKRHSEQQLCDENALLMLEDGIGIILRKQQYLR